MLFDKIFKKQPHLFDLDVRLEPYNQDVLYIAAKKVAIAPNGNAIINGKIAGKVYMWDYIKQFGTPDVMKRTGFNEFTVDVCGEADTSLIFPDPHDKPYIYNCGNTCDNCPPMMPHTEYLCDMRYDHDNKNRYDVYVAGKKVGSLEDKHDRVPKLVRMLHSGYQATAQVEPNLAKFSLYVVVRKV
jgi:hypothetical protein